MDKPIRLSNRVDQSAPTHPCAPVPKQWLPAINVDSWDFRKIAQEGTVLSNALYVGDVDGDGVEEVIFGTTEGHLVVIKPDYRFPVYRDVLPSTISVVLYSGRHRRLIVVTLEGHCKVTEDFLSPSSTSSSSYFCSRDPDPRSTAVYPSRPRSRGEFELRFFLAAQKFEQRSTSFTFSIVPNCMCGDLGWDADREMVFLGSYDHRVYVYSLEGACLGSISLQAPVSSLKCFSVPPFGVASTDEQTIKGYSSRISAHSSTTAQPQSEAPCGFFPMNVQMLLVSCSQRIVLLNASCADVKKWVGTDSIYSIAVQHEEDDISPERTVKAFNGPPSQRTVLPLSSQTPRPDSVSSHMTEGPQCLTEPFLSDEEDVEPEENTLQPVWQMQICPASLLAFPSKDEKCFPSPSSGSIPSRIFSYENPSAFFRQDSAEGVMPAGNSSSFALSEKEQLSATHDLRFPVVVDVAVGRSCVQFAAVSEDGRCYILEMCNFRAESANDCPVSTEEPRVDHSSANLEKSANVVTMGSEAQLTASIRCTWRGLLKQQAFVSQVCVFPVRGDEFCSVFLATDGTCYVLDSRGAVIVESHIKADASSFTIMTGGFAAHPMFPLACPTFTTSSFSDDRDSALSANVLQQQQQQQQNILRGLVGRIVSIVSVTVNELVISSVGGESYLFAPTGSHLRGSPASSTHISEYKRGVEMGNTEIECTLSHDDEEEEELMLQLGTLLLETGGYVDPCDLFTEEERRIVARKLCAYGYSNEDWKVLEQVAENLSE